MELALLERNNMNKEVLYNKMYYIVQQVMIEKGIIKGQDAKSLKQFDFVECNMVDKYTRMLLCEYSTQHMLSDKIYIALKRDAKIERIFDEL